KDGEMFAYKHDGFWQPMDTLRDNQKLNKLWKENKAPWKVW
ncbi:MAG: glucose-1-phosphate cytidylyltransferase, partial [Bacilli bacterium]|nr:glucose-1-phosphate cytidylyltransferase [Bacilli bacterium]